MEEGEPYTAKHKQPHRRKGTPLAGKFWGEAEKPNDFFSEVFCVIHDVKTLFHLFAIVNIFIILLDPIVRPEFP